MTDNAQVASTTIEEDDLKNRDVLTNPKRTRRMSVSANEQLKKARQDKRRRYITVLATEHFNECLTDGAWTHQLIENSFDYIVKVSLSIAKIIMGETTWSTEFLTEGENNQLDAQQAVINGYASDVMRYVQDKLDGRNQYSPKRALERMENFKEGVRFALAKSKLI